MAGKEGAMKKTLVVYFSRSGYTREIAEAIVAGVGADIECVQEFKGRLGIFGYLRSVREALQQRTVPIRPPARNPSDYDLVIIGTPVWASNVCSPVRAYIREQQNRLGRIALFCTQGGSGAMKVLARMAQLCGHQPVATLIVNDNEITQHRYADKLNGFLKAIALPQAA